MNDLLEAAIRIVRDLPPARQEMIARVILNLSSGDEAPVRLTGEERASFAASLGQADRRDFASDEDVRAIWAKHGF